MENLPLQPAALYRKNKEGCVILHIKDAVTSKKLEINKNPFLI